MDATKTVWWEKALAVVLALGFAYLAGIVLWPGACRLWQRITAATQDWQDATPDHRLDRLDRRMDQAEADIASLKKNKGDDDDFEHLEGSAPVHPRRQVSIQHLPGGGVKIRLP